MTASTHYAFSFLVTTAAGCSYQSALLGSLFALFPDIDHPQSLIGRVFPSLSKYLLRKYGHRTVTHSVLAVLIIALVLTPTLFFSKQFYVAALLGYFSHIFIDLFNVSGVKLLAPWSQKEYISFKTKEARIPVSSWKEYLLMFIIVFLAFSTAGKSFSMTSAIRSIAKVIFKDYRGAIIDFRDNSHKVCMGKMTYYDNITRQKVSGNFKVLNLYKEKGFFDNNYSRLVLVKTDIVSIEINPTDKLLKAKHIKGSDLSELSKVTGNSYIAGKVVFYNYVPEIKTSDSIEMIKDISKTTIVCKYLTIQEFNILIIAQQNRDKKLEKLKNKLCDNQIKILTKESKVLLYKMQILSNRGFYQNYQAINDFDKQVKKINAKIESLKLKKTAGEDKAIIKEINQLEEGGRVDYDVWVYEI